MWAAETNPGDLALLRVPLSSFSDGRDSAPASAYRSLPKPAGYALQSRYVGAYLLYGAGTGWHRPQPTAQSQLYAVRYAGGAETFEVPLVHAVDRIEALGGNAVAVGSDGRDLHFTSLRLARFPVAVDRYTRKDAAQGETRSHGFFYKPESRRGRHARPADHRRRRAGRPAAAQGVRGAALPAEPGLELQRARDCSRRARPQPSGTTAAAPPAWTGTATRGRSSSAAACSR